MNILNEFIGEFKKEKVFTVAGVGLVLSPSIVIMNLIYTLLLPSMASSDPSGVSADIAYLVFNLIASIIIAPVLEELTYRGLMLIFIKLTHKPVIVLLISSAVFGFMHEGTFGSFQATIAGVILGYIAYEYGLAFSIILHMSVNSISLINGYLPSFLSGSAVVLVLIIEICLGVFIFIKNNDYLLADIDFSYLISIKRKVVEFWQKNIRK